MTEHWHPACVICASRGRTRELEHGHVCRACAVALRADLAAIVEAAAIAAVLPDPYASKPSSGAGRPAPDSRPPLNVAHIDPALVLLPVGIHEKVDPDDRYSGEPLLALLENWARIVREERHLSPYGVATEARLKAVTQADVAEVTLADVVGFLRSHVDWMCDEPEFAVDELAADVRRGLGALRALDPSLEHEVRWTIPCPADAAAAS